jgi:hypothetical protein
MLNVPKKNFCLANYTRFFRKLKKILRKYALIDGFFQIRDVLNL